MKAACRLVLAALAVLPCTAAAAAAPKAAPVPPLRAIAIAEDQRAWKNGVLKRFLSDTSAALRARAALAVGRLQDTTSVPALLPLLADRSSGPRREAVFALGQIGWKGARENLERSLADSDPEVVDLAIEALGKLGDKAATAKVAGFLDSPRAEQRAHAAVALWRLADTSAVAPLLARLGQKGEQDAAVRWRVVYALEKLPLPLRIAPAVQPLLHDPDPLVRAHAARTLGRVKSRASVGALVAALADSDDAVVVNAMRSLQGIADSANTAQLPALFPLLHHPDPYVRVTAATALADSFAWGKASPAATANARTALANGLADADAATRGACARAIIMRYARRAPSAIRSLQSDSSVFVRAAFLDGVRQLGDSSAAARLLPASLGASRPLLERTTAAEVAGQLGGKLHAVMLAPLLAMLRAGIADREILYVAACAGALADWGDSASVKLLAKAYKAHRLDAASDARDAIRDALVQLAGKAFADSVVRTNKVAAKAPVYAKGFESAPRERGAVLHTTAGDIEWAFEAAVAPQTVRNFVTLARKSYFNGLVVHRVVPDFVIQDGDPTGTGSGGPGWTIRCEYNQLRYEAGMVGMALSGKDTGGSQWFITLSPQEHLNGRYTIFAHVVRGLDVARRITQGTVVKRVEILQ